MSSRRELRRSSQQRGARSALRSKLALRHRSSSPGRAQRSWTMSIASRRAARRGSSPPPGRSPARRTGSLHRGTSAVGRARQKLRVLHHTAAAPRLRASAHGSGCACCSPRARCRRGVRGRRRRRRRGGSLSRRGKRRVFDVERRRRVRRRRSAADGHRRRAAEASEVRLKVVACDLTTPTCTRRAAPTRRAERRRSSATRRIAIESPGGRVISVKPGDRGGDAHGDDLRAPRVPERTCRTAHAVLDEHDGGHAKKCCGVTTAAARRAMGCRVRRHLALQGRNSARIILRPLHGLLHLRRVHGRLGDAERQLHRSTRAPTWARSVGVA